MKKLSLTFDDGPNRQTTSALLDVLSRHGVLATFFLIGERSEAQAVLTKRIERRGHEIGNHTQTHKDLRGLSWEELDHEIKGWGKYFRPPGGHCDEGLLKYLDLNEMWLTLWHIDSFDYALKTPEEICAVIDEQIDMDPNKDAIILLHDGDSENPNGDRWATVEAVDRLIRIYQSAGYEFVPLEQMALPGTPRRITA